MQQNDRHIYSRAEPPLRVQRTTCLGLLTKPITTVTAMMLFEQGKQALTDPVGKYILAFNNVKVGVTCSTSGSPRGKSPAPSC